MKIKVKKVNDSQVEMNITNAWKDIEEDYYKELNKLLSNASQKGARKGKLVGIQKQLFIKNNKDYIDSNFVEFAMNAYYQEALRKEELIPINQGQVSKIDFNGEKSDFNFIIIFEIRPDLSKKIPNYSKKITIKTNHYIATSKDVDKSIEEVRAQHASMKSVDRKLKSGDFIHADFTKLDQNNNPVEGGVLPNHHIKIGEGLFVGDMEKPFLNKKIGDEIKIEVQQEKDKVKYLVKINKIEEQILPKVDNAFAKLLDKNLKTVKDLKSKFKENIQINLDQENKKEFHNKIVEYFIEKTKFEPPKSMIENYKQYLIEDYKSKNDKNFDEKKLSNEMDQISHKNISWLLIREHLINNEKISISSDDVENEIKKSLEQSPNYKKDIKKFYNDEQNKNKLRDDLLNKEFFNKMGKYFINKSKNISTDKIRNKKG